jgi:hypothetical protein
MEGRKTQTRRIIKSSLGLQKTWLTEELINKVPHGEIINGGWQMHHPLAGKYKDGIYVKHDSPLGWVKCPYGRPNDILWVRKTWAMSYETEDHPELLDNLQEIWDTGYVYKADGEPFYKIDKWISPRFMPKIACRIRLKITDIRVERVRDISNHDVIAEGLVPFITDHPKGGFYVAYQTLWESINGKDSWDKNPWVWCISFKKTNYDTEKAKET